MQDETRGCGHSLVSSIHDCSMEARIATAGRVHLRPLDVLASGRMSLDRSHRVHNAGEVSLMRTAELAARQDLGKAVLAARRSYILGIDREASAWCLMRAGISSAGPVVPKSTKTKPQQPDATA